MPWSCVDPRTLIFKGLTLSIVLDVGRDVPALRVELGQRPRTTGKRGRKFKENKLIKFLSSQSGGESFS
jgi:hypothetical protein